jgi:hypothetical protein
LSGSSLNGSEDSSTLFSLTTRGSEGGLASIDYSTCVNKSWKGGVFRWRICPTDYVQVGMHKRKSDSGTWSYYKCCKLQ